MPKLTVDGIEVEVCASATARRGGGRVTRTSLSVIALSALLLPTTVQAKPEFSELETRRKVREYADCVVSRHAPMVKKVFVQDWRNREILRRGSLLVSENCAASVAGASGIQMKFGMDTYRYALADALVRREFGTLSPALVSQAVKMQPLPAAPDHTQLPKNKRKAEELKKGWAAKFLEIYGDCVVKSSPAESLALLKTTEGGKQETAAFATLQPSLATCLPPNNTLRFQRFPLRGAIAMSYAEAAVAATTGASPGGSVPSA